MNLEAQPESSAASALDQVRIVLVEPAGPLNVGSVARVMKNMGLRQLILVNPQCDPLSDPARRMAVHAGELLEQAQIVRSLPEALAGCVKAIATTGKTGRDRTTLPIVLESPRACLPWLLMAPAQPVALIFGREDSGLTTQELNYAQRFLQIPTDAVYPSLNLAQAVAICCYELQTAERMQDEPLQAETAPPISLSPGLAPTHTLAPLQVLERFYQQLETLLLSVGYLYPHTARSRMKKFRRLFGRALLSPTEVALLQGVLRQITWALQSSRLSPNSTSAEETTREETRSEDARTEDARTESRIENCRTEKPE